MSAPKPLVDQPTKAPTRKLVAAGTTGVGVILVVWVAGLLGVDLTPEVAGSLVLAAGLAAGYVKRNAPAIVDRLDRTPGQHLDRDGDGVADR
jgi:tetrahydromethanopterin S-methyltransferase subunit D